MEKRFTFLIKLTALDKNRKVKTMTIIELGHFSDETALDFEVKCNEHLQHFLFHNHCERGFYQICGVCSKKKKIYFY